MPPPSGPPDMDERGRRFIEAAHAGHPLPDGAGIRLRRVILSGANLSRSVLRDADLGGTILTEACLDGATLDNANFVASDLAGASLVATSARNADFRGANLREADLRDADLEGADVHAADARGADLRGTCLRGTSENWLSREGAQLSALTLDRSGFTETDALLWYREGARLSADIAPRITLPSRTGSAQVALQFSLAGESRERLGLLPILALGPATRARLVAFDSYARYSVLWMEGFDAGELRRFMGWLVQPLERVEATRLERFLKARLGGFPMGYSRRLGWLLQELFSPDEVHVILAEVGAAELSHDLPMTGAYGEAAVLGLERRGAVEELARVLLARVPNHAADIVAFLMSEEE